MSLPRLADGRHAPRVTADNRAYWEAAAAGELQLPWCLDCGMVFAPFGPVCPRCLSDRLEWRPAGGGGVVTSYVVFHHPYLEAFEDRRPYTVALVELDEGPRLLANLLDNDLGDAAPDSVEVGARVHVCFEQVGDVALPQFRPEPAP